MVAAGMPEPDSAVSNVMRSVCPALGERGPVTTSSPLAPCCRAAQRLVTEIGVAGERGLRLRVGVFGEVVEDEDDLVLDVEARRSCRSPSPATREPTRP